MMRWPWTRRKHLEAQLAQAAEKARERERILVAQVDELRAENAQLVHIKEMLSAHLGVAQDQVALAQAQAAEARDECHKLLDRVVQLSGQAPIFAEPPAVPPDSPKSSVSGPTSRLTFNDVKAEVRKAMAQNKLNLVPRSS